MALNAPLVCVGGCPPLEPLLATLRLASVASSAAAALCPLLLSPDDSPKLVAGGLVSEKSLSEDIAPNAVLRRMRITSRSTADNLYLG